jgi:hypothetical protein
MAFDDPPPSAEQQEEADRLHSLNRARAILATYYIVLPFILVYLLFKIFPPQPWFPPDWRSVQMVFFVPRLNIWTTLEERLILLVVVGGALGSYIHTATSYADFRGNRQFGPSWLLWYLLRPFIGTALALVVYFAIRGGLLSIILSGSEANDATKINPFGIAAIASLTGMFSKQAADKLAEVFTTLFKSQGDQSRRDPLAPAPAPTIEEVDPPQGPPAGGTPVTIKGTGFASGATVVFAENAATDIVFVNATTLTLKTPSGTGVVDVVVTNPDAQKATAKQAFAYTAVDTAAAGAEAPVDGEETGDEDAIDGCDVKLEADTPDEALPITEGGVK